MSLIKLKNNALDNLTSFEGSASLGDMVLVSSATASSSASIEFDLGSYKEYKFFFVNMHPATDNVNFQVGFRDGGSSYDAIKTTTTFRAQHNEGDTQALLGYATSPDLAQSTGYQTLEGAANALSNDNDHGLSGELHLFNPSSTTYVKHFIARTSATNPNDYALDGFVAGYLNTTVAIDGIKFQMSSGNIDDGKILMFGLN
jgi:hypothetical protein